MSDTINGTIRWSGEHWINYLRRTGENTDSGCVYVSELAVIHWGPTIGSERSSCVFALAETTIRLEDEA